MSFLFIADFKVDSARQCISGSLSIPEKSLIGATFYSEEFSNVTGYVSQCWVVSEEQREKLNLSVGSWFGVIEIENGWNIIESGMLKRFVLVENDSAESIPIIQTPGKYMSIEKFIKVNKPHELSSFDIDVRGGSTEGAGRNEHGEPHFHLLKKRSRVELGKINIPDVETWKRAENKLKLIQVEGGDITRAERKELIEWLDKDNCKNLHTLLKEWNERNKDNITRATLKLL